MISFILHPRSNHQAKPNFYFQTKMIIIKTSIILHNLIQKMTLTRGPKTIWNKQFSYSKISRMMSKTRSMLIAIKMIASCPIGKSKLALKKQIYRMMKISINNYHQNWRVLWRKFLVQNNNSAHFSPAKEVRAFLIDLKTIKEKDRKTCN